MVDKVADSPGCSSFTGKKKCEIWFTNSSTVKGSTLTIVKFIFKEWRNFPTRHKLRGCLEFITYPAVWLDNRDRANHGRLTFSHTFSSTFLWKAGNFSVVIYKYLPQIVWICSIGPYIFNLIAVDSEITRKVYRQKIPYED